HELARDEPGGRGCRDDPPPVGRSRVARSETTRSVLEHGLPILIVDVARPTSATREHRHAEDHAGDTEDASDHRRRSLLGTTGDFQWPGAGPARRSSYSAIAREDGLQCGRSAATRGGDDDVAIPAAALAQESSPPDDRRRGTPFLTAAFAPRGGGGGFAYPCR